MSDIVINDLIVHEVWCVYWVHTCVQYVFCNSGLLMGLSTI